LTLKRKVVSTKYCQTLVCCQKLYTKAETYIQMSQGHTFIYWFTARSDWFRVSSYKAMTTGLHATYLWYNHQKVNVITK